jgi:hypothetical protein
MNSATGAWNTRFGIYDNPYSQYGTPAAPDFTGYAYFGPQINAYSDFVKERAKFAAYQGDPTGITVKGSTSASGTNYAAGADRRLALAPEVDCGPLLSQNGTHQAQVLWWDCVLMLDPMDKAGDPVHLEYEGKSTDPNVPCAAFGIPGDSATLGPLVPVLVQ